MSEQIDHTQRFIKVIRDVQAGERQVGDVLLDEHDLLIATDERLKMARADIEALKEEIKKLTRDNHRLEEMNDFLRSVIKKAEEADND